VVTQPTSYMKYYEKNYNFINIYYNKFVVFDSTSYKGVGWVITVKYLDFLAFKFLK